MLDILFLFTVQNCSRCKDRAIPWGFKKIIPIWRRAFP